MRTPFPRRQLVSTAQVDPGALVPETEDIPGSMAARSATSLALGHATCCRAGGLSLLDPCHYFLPRSFHHTSLSQIYVPRK